MALAAAVIVAATIVGGGDAAAGRGGGEVRSGEAVAHAAAAAPRVQVMVVGRTRTLRGPTSVVARPARVRVGARRCLVGAGTPIAALAALRSPTFALRDFGACSARSAAASELLYVSRIGADRARGFRGWVYKVGRRALSIGGGNPRARVRAGGRVLWFYCRMGPRGCQSTLELTGPVRAAPGGAVTFTARAYDDRGRGSAAAGATISFAGQTAITGSDGTATLPAPGAPGVHRAGATAGGLVPSFPREVRVG